MTGFDEIRRCLRAQGKTLLDYIAEHPGTTGYSVGVAHQSQWDMFHTAALLLGLTEEGCLRREENVQERQFLYWRTDKPYEVQP